MLIVCCYLHMNICTPIHSFKFISSMFNFPHSLFNIQPKNATCVIIIADFAKNWILKELQNFFFKTIRKKECKLNQYFKNCTFFFSCFVSIPIHPCKLFHSKKTMAWLLTPLFNCMPWIVESLENQQCNV